MTGAADGRRRLAMGRTRGGTSIRVLLCVAKTALIDEVLSFADISRLLELSIAEVARLREL